jgi:hypothetical protein
LTAPGYLYGLLLILYIFIYLDILFIVEEVQIIIMSFNRGMTGANTIPLGSPSAKPTARALGGGGVGVGVSLLNPSYLAQASVKKERKSLYHCSVRIRTRFRLDPDTVPAGSEYGYGSGWIRTGSGYATLVS